MSHPKGDAPLDDATLRALRESDDLVPSSDAEVERAEANLPHELELPAGLLSYRPPSAEPGNVRQLPRRSSHILGYSVAAALGGLAAAAAATWLAPAPNVPVTNAGGELVPQNAKAKAPPVALTFQSRCEQACCAGSACKSAPAALATCPSGLRCADCAADNVAGGPYRLRVGSVIVSDVGQKLLPLQSPLELCISGPGGTPECLPALGDGASDAWRLLKVVTPLQDLLSGLSVELRKRGDTTALASWRHAVSPTPDIMCKGLAIQLNDGTETLGRLSAFVEPTHFVELARATAVPPLLQALRGFDISGAEPRIFETTQSGAARFALVLGPFDKPDADALRWQVLDHGVDASVSHGLDFVGSPRPTRSFLK